MKLLFFPFTHLSEKDAESVLTCFQRFSFISTKSREEFVHGDEPLKNSTFIDFIFTEQEELRPVLERVHEYRAWAEIHGGGAKGYLKSLLRDTPYFTSDTMVGNIRTQINTRINKRAGKQDVKAGRISDHKDREASDQKDSFAENLLFLRLAQEQDAENESIDSAFSAVSFNEQQIIASVKGESANAENRVQDDDPALYMSEKRIDAWAGLFKEKKGQIVSDDPLLFVTTSRAVIDILKQRAEKSLKILDSNNTKVYEDNCMNHGRWMAEFHDTLQDSVVQGLKGKKGKNSIDKIDIKLYFFQGIDIENIFCLAQGDGGKNRVHDGSCEGSIPVVLVCVQEKYLI